MVIQSTESLRQDSLGAQIVEFVASLLRGRDLSLPVMMRLEFESVEVGKTGSPQPTALFLIVLNVILLSAGADFSASGPEGDMLAT